MCNWWSVLLLPATPGEGQVRLVGGSGPHEGHVEVYHNGIWENVCSDYLDLQVAMVVCRQLGYGTAVSAPRNTAFGGGRGLAWYFVGSCSGHEDNLTQCGNTGLGGVYFTCYQAVGVICASE